MKIAVLGTGMVGQAHAARLIDLGHAVYMGTRNPKKGPADSANQLNSWIEAHPSVKLMTFAEAAQRSEMIINALNGEIAVTVLKSIEAGLGDKVVIDISNPLDFSKGMPPRLSVSNNDSLGEQLQSALPKVSVVKTLNTVNCLIQVEPKRLAAADHTVFVSGNNMAAKETVIRLLQEYGWRRIIDLGDIETARGAEMYMPLWLRLMDSLKTVDFNLKIVVNE
jgi:predicted dinucleotide-binding enzyme